MGKANISFPEGMLEEIDRRATASGATRSSFIQEAAARYLAQLDHDSEVSLRSVRIEEAIQGLRRLGETIPSGPSGVGLIREIRGAEGSPRAVGPKARSGGA